MDEQRTTRTDPATWQALEDEANAMYLADTWAKKWADTEAQRIAELFQHADRENRWAQAIQLAITHISGQATKFSERDPLAVLDQLRAALEQQPVR